MVGLGGYASAPMAQAAVRQGLPLILLEQNAVPGKATRWFASHATLICAAMPQTTIRNRIQINFFIFLLLIFMTNKAILLIY